MSHKGLTDILQIEGLLARFRGQNSPGEHLQTAARGWFSAGTDADGRSYLPDSAVSAYPGGCQARLSR
jgi:hypothetical protein